MSGGYEDDQDHGSWIVYTGHGGRDPNTGKQVADQSIDASGNAALMTSSLTGRPVRVVRGRNPDSPFAPSAGFRYDGLFRVESWWTERGQSGFAVCQFRMVQLAGDPIEADENDTERKERPDGHDLDGTEAPGRRLSTVQRVIRSSAIADSVKGLHDHTCQMCGTRLTVRGQGYSEGAHIQPLGSPHDGPDVRSNMLCLCPNCHVLFDNGEIAINADLVLTGARTGSLKTHPKHSIDLVFLDYHRKMFVEVAYEHAKATAVSDV